MGRNLLNSENRLPFTAKSLLLGLLVAQLIAAVQVYLSNLNLYHSLSAIKASGYLTIPNQLTMPGLQDFVPAFLGGLFFTLSVGAGLTLLSIGAAWLWHRVFSRNRYVLIFFFLFWGGAFVGLNHRGFSFGATCYFFVIPPVVFLATLRCIPLAPSNGEWVRGAVNTFPLLVLALLWTSQVDRHFFVDFRDIFLLSNPVGIKVNDFYYDYTLYPAEVFKSLDQKLLKTCTLQDLKKSPLHGRLERELLERDYLTMAPADAVDLTVAEDKGLLDFKHGGKIILQSTVAEFLSDPETVLEEFSSKTDRHIFFRKFTFYSLLMGLPLALYLLFYALIRLLCCFFWDVRTSSLIASICCLIVGLSILIPFHYMREKDIESKDVHLALASKSWQERVGALRIIERKGLELNSFPSYSRLLTSPHIAERYWLARGLAVSHRPETYGDLLVFLDDPHPNVVSMAFYGLGQRGDRRAISEILNRIRKSYHWYNQWYAYKALRALGWKQKKSG